MADKDRSPLAVSEEGIKREKHLVPVKHQQGKVEHLPKEYVVATQYAVSVLS